jgi:hypothetical protein
MWVYIAAIAETAQGLRWCLASARFAALGACGLLAIAVYSLQVVKGFGWTWNTGGYEYPMFRAIVSLAVRRGMEGPTRARAGASHNGSPQGRGLKQRKTRGIRSHAALIR